jgi:hypothetical protein
MRLWSSPPENGAPQKSSSIGVIAGPASAASKQRERIHQVNICFTMDSDNDMTI